MDEKVIEAARKYGYNGMFAHKNSLDDLISWTAVMGSADESRVALIAAMVAVNTLAMLIAKSEVEAEESYESLDVNKFV